MSRGDLIQRLTAIRGTIRRRLVLYGLFALGCMAGVGFTTLVVLDWWLWLPGALRLSLGASLLLGLTVASVRWLVRPLCAGLANGVLAGRLERHFPRLSDTLSSAVSFLERGSGRGGCAGDSESEAMVRRALESAERAARATPLEEALTRQPLMRMLLMLVLVVAGVGLLGWAWPGGYAIGLRRYANPLGTVTWPRRVELRSLQGETKVAVGGSLLVRMRILRGLDDELRGVVRVRDAAGGTSTFAMQREDRSDFYCTIERITGDLRYWFEAGDASTADSPCRVRVVTPPSVAQAVVRVEAPEYAQPRASAEFELTGSVVRAVVGSTLTVSVRSTQPVGVDDQGQATAGLELSGGRSVALVRAGDEGLRLSGTFELAADEELSIRLRDADGFENGMRRSHRLVAIPDEAPTVHVLSPSASVEVTPAGSIPLTVRVEDDLGIRGVRLIGRLTNREQEFKVALADHPAGSEQSGRVTAEVSQTWSLEGLELRPGDRLSYRIAVTDNYGYGGADPQTSVSAPLRLKVASKADFENQVRDEFAQHESRLRRILLDQESMRDEVAKLTHSLDATEAELSATQREDRVPRRLGRRQLRLADQLRRLTERFGRIGER
ncbi:MAG: DUF4175 domain-containing protein, partial [bacterium]|nr:DUF4175 domain-containing protein [bacterium]